MDSRKEMALDADRYAKYHQEQDGLTIAQWMRIAWAREVPTPLPMPAGTTLNLGAGYRNIGSSIPLDLEHGWDANNEPLDMRYEPGSIAGIWAHGFFEHVRNPIAVLRGCEAVLEPGGVLNIVVPHGLSDMWAEDLTHEKRFTEDTFRNLFGNPYYDAGDWAFDIHTCFIMGVAWRNLALFTQLVKTFDQGGSDA